MPASMTILYRQVRLVGLPAGLSRLTSRFDMDEEGVDYAEIADLLLDPDTSGLRSNLPINRKSRFFRKPNPIYGLGRWYIAVSSTRC